MRSRTYAAAAPELVAMTDTSDAPIASWMSMPKTRVSTGTTMIPPPMPSSAPSAPAPIETPNMMIVNSSGVIDPPL
jgi:hypothetical protein